MVEFKKGIVVFGVACLLTLFLKTSDAILEINITEGKNSAIPIAVSDFADTGTLKLPVEIGEIVRSDLNVSGALKAEKGPLPNFEDPYSLVNQWKNKGAHYIVTGQISEQKDAQYLVRYQLLSVFGEEPVLLNLQASTSSSKLRTLSHLISNKVYQTILGKPGFFDSSIAYVLKRRQPDSLIYKLIVADYDGQREKEVIRSSKALMSPDLSPDKRSVVYVSFEKDISQIYIQDLYTGKRQLVSSEKGINSSPAWSPDGKKLAFVLSKGSNVDIYIYDVETRYLKKLTKHFGIDTEPFWLSNDDIVFTSNRGGGPQLYSTNLSQRSVKRLTYQGRFNTSAAVSKDGEQLAFVHRNDRGYQIAIKPLNSSSIEILTHSQNNVTPSFSPDGNMILYATKKNGRSVLGLMSTDGKHQVILPSDEGDVIDPVWSK